MHPVSTVLTGGTLALVCALPSQAATCSMLLSLMAFGIYDTVLPLANETSATIQVACTPGLGNPLTTAYTITIAGTGSSNDSVRAVTSGPHRLYYQIYKDPARSSVWGNGGSSGPGVASSVTSLSSMLPGLQVHTAYARMPALQNIPPGIYAGSLMVTIDY